MEWTTCITPEQYGISLLQDNTVVSAQLWVGWTSFYTTEQKSNAVHVLCPSPREFCGRVRTIKKHSWTYFHRSRKRVKSLLWKNAKQTNAQARLTSTVYVKIWSTRKFTLASKGISCITQSSRNSSLQYTEQPRMFFGNNLLLRVKRNVVFRLNWNLVCFILMLCSEISWIICVFNFILMSIVSGNLLCNIDIFVAVVLKVPIPVGVIFLLFPSARLEVMVSPLFQILQARCKTFYCRFITLPSHLILTRVRILRVRSSPQKCPNFKNSILFLSRSRVKWRAAQ